MRIVSTQHPQVLSHCLLNSSLGPAPPRIRTINGVGRRLPSHHHFPKAGMLSGLFCCRKNPNSHRGLRIRLKGGTPRLTPNFGRIRPQISLSSLFGSKAPSRPRVVISMA